MIRRALIIGVSIGAVVGCTKAVWRSGFDQGADVAICVSASFQQSRGDAVVTMAKAPACDRARAYQSNPLWAFRRRKDGE